MGDEIKIKKGLLVNLPELTTAEMALTIDEERLYIGGTNGNIPIAMKKDTDNIQFQINDIVNPFTISLSSNPSVTETGSTQNSIIFTWTYPRTPVSQTFEGSSLLNTLLTKTYTTPITTNKTFTLIATIEGGIVKTKTLTLSFYNGVYYGKSTRITYDATLINSLTKVLSDTRGRTISVTAGVGEYIYYCIPTRLGTASFAIGGFSGGFSKVSTLSFTNTSGYSESYDIYKSDNTNLGLTSVVIS